MPELPEVEIVRRGLTQHTLGQPIVGAEVLLPRTIAHPPNPKDFIQLLLGKQFVNWHRRGKYLLGKLDSSCETGADGQTALSVTQQSQWLGVHLRMTGQLLWLSQDVPLSKHTRVRLFFADRQELRFVDQRTFGQMWCVPATAKPSEIITGLRYLGPEPLSNDFSLTYLAQQLKHRQRSLKSALLDQSIIAGLGNIYADESLFLSGLRPTRSCRGLSQAEIRNLHKAVIQVLEASLGQGGTTFSDFRDVSGINGNYGGVAWVYGRTGESCRVCKMPIAKVKLAGRSTHYCPVCQPEVGV